MSHPPGLGGLVYMQGPSGPEPSRTGRSSGRSQAIWSWGLRRSLALRSKGRVRAARPVTSVSPWTAGRPSWHRGLAVNLVCGPGSLLRPQKGGLERLPSWGTSLETDSVTKELQNAQHVMAGHPRSQAPSCFCTAALTGSSGVNTGMTPCPFQSKGQEALHTGEA